MRVSPVEREKNRTIAAIDLGTNSVHLVVAQIEADGHLNILDSDKIGLRLGESLDEHFNLSKNAITKTVDAFKHLQEVASTHDPIYRAVATHATRIARNCEDLVRAVYDATSIQIAIIDGLEEARLMSLGIMTSFPLKQKTFIGVDIGGGSTEIILRRGGEIKYATSLPLGAVMLTKTFLSKGTIKKSHIRDLVLHIAIHIEPLAAEIEGATVELAIACSGAAKALAGMHSRDSDEELLDPNGYVLTADDLKELNSSIQTMRTPEKIRSTWNLDQNRSEIILAGCAILNSVTNLFKVQQWVISSNGLREGLVMDTSARITEALPNFDGDIRGQSIKRLGKKLQIDEVQAEAVSSLAVDLYDQFRQYSPKRLSKHGTFLDDLGLLQAAAWLHECGKFISFPKYHRHSTYLILNSRLLGFSQKERQLIGLIARFHRRGTANKKRYECRDLRSSEVNKINFLAAILRLAAAANRTRKGLIARISANVYEDTVELVVHPSGKIQPNMDVIKLTQEKKALTEALGKTISVSIDGQE